MRYICYECRQDKKEHLYPRLKLVCLKCIRAKLKELERYKKLLN